MENAYVKSAKLKGANFVTNPHLLPYVNKTALWVPITADDSRFFYQLMAYVPEAVQSCKDKLIRLRDEYAALGDAFQRARDVIPVPDSYEADQENEKGSVEELLAGNPTHALLIKIDRLSKGKYDKKAIRDIYTTNEKSLPILSNDDPDALDSLPPPIRAAFNIMSGSANNITIAIKRKADRLAEKVKAAAAASKAKEEQEAAAKLHLAQLKAAADELKKKEEREAPAKLHLAQLKAAADALENKEAQEVAATLHLAQVKAAADALKKKEAQEALKAAADALKKKEEREAAAKLYLAQVKAAEEVAAKLHLAQVKATADALQKKEEQGAAAKQLAKEKEKEEALISRIFARMAISAPGLFDSVAGVRPRVTVYNQDIKELLETGSEFHANFGAGDMFDAFA